LKEELAFHFTNHYPLTHGSPNQVVVAPLFNFTVFPYSYLEVDAIMGTRRRRKLPSTQEHCPCERRYVKRGPPFVMIGERLQMGSHHNDCSLRGGVMILFPLIMAAMKAALGMLVVMTTIEAFILPLPSSTTTQYSTLLPPLLILRAEIAADQVSAWMNLCRKHGLAA